MNELMQIVLEAETQLPMELAGWGILALAVLLTVVWLVFLYR